MQEWPNIPLLKLETLDLTFDPSSMLFSTSMIWENAMSIVAIIAFIYLMIILIQTSWKQLIFLLVRKATLYYQINTPLDQKSTFEMSRKHRRAMPPKQQIFKRVHPLTDEEILDKKITSLSNGKSNLVDNVKAALKESGVPLDLEFFDETVPPPVTVSKPEVVLLPAPRPVSVLIRDPGAVPDHTVTSSRTDPVALGVVEGDTVWDHLIADAYIPNSKLPEFLKIAYSVGAYTSTTSPNYPGFVHVSIFRSHAALMHFKGLNDKIPF